MPFDTNKLDEIDKRICQFIKDDLIEFFKEINQSTSSNIEYNKVLFLSIHIIQVKSCFISQTGETNQVTEQLQVAAQDAQHLTQDSEHIQGSSPVVAWLSFCNDFLINFLTAMTVCKQEQSPDQLASQFDHLIYYCKTYLEKQDASSIDDLVHYQSFQQLILFLLFYDWHYDLADGPRQNWLDDIVNLIWPSNLNDEIRQGIAFIQYWRTTEVVQEDNCLIQCDQAIQGFALGEQNELASYIARIMALTRGSILPQYLRFCIESQLTVEASLAVIRQSSQAQQANTYLTNLHKVIYGSQAPTTLSGNFLTKLSHLTNLVICLDRINMFYDPTFVAHQNFYQQAIQTVVDYYHNHNWSNKRSIINKLYPFISHIEHKIKALTSLQANNKKDTLFVQQQQAIDDILSNELRPLLSISDAQPHKIWDFTQKITRFLDNHNIKGICHRQREDEFLPHSTDNTPSVKALLSYAPTLSELLLNQLRTNLVRLYDLIPADKLTANSPSLKAVMDITYISQTMAQHLGGRLGLEQQQQAYCQIIHADFENAEHLDQDESSSKNAKKRNKKKQRARQKQKAQQQNENAKQNNTDTQTQGGAASSSATTIEQPTINSDWLPQPVWQLAQKMHEKGYHMILTGGAVGALTLKALSYKSQPPIRDYDCLINMDLYQLKHVIEQQGWGWTLEDPKGKGHPTLSIDCGGDSNCIIEVSYLPYKAGQDLLQILKQLMYKHDFKLSALYVILNRAFSDSSYVDQALPANLSLAVHDEVGALQSLKHQNLSVVVPQHHSVNDRFQQDLIRLFRFIKYRLTYPELKPNQKLNDAIIDNNKPTLWQPFIKDNSTHQGQVGTAIKGLLERFTVETVLDRLINKVPILWALTDIPHDLLARCSATWCDYIHQKTAREQQQIGDKTQQHNPSTIIAEQQKQHLFFCILATYCLLDSQSHQGKLARGERQTKLERLKTNWPFYQVIQHIPPEHKQLFNYIIQRCSSRTSFAYTIACNRDKDHPEEKTLIDSLQNELGINLNDTTQGLYQYNVYAEQMTNSIKSESRAPSSEYSKTSDPS